MKKLTNSGQMYHQWQGWVANTKVSALKQYVLFLPILRYQQVSTNTLLVKLEGNLGPTNKNTFNYQKKYSRNCL